MNEAIASAIEETDVKCVVQRKRTFMIQDKLTFEGFVLRHFKFRLRQTELACLTVVDAYTTRLSQTERTTDLTIKVTRQVWIHDQSTQRLMDCDLADPLNGNGGLAVDDEAAR